MERSDSKDKVSGVSFRLMGGPFDTEISTIGIEFLYLQMYIETSW